MAILLVTHDWGVIADICERVVVMYAGQVVERADIAPILTRPCTPTPRPARREPDHRPRGRAASDDPGQRAQARRLAGRLPLPPAVRVRDDRVPRAVVPLEQPDELRETRCIHYEDLVAVSN